ncbi:hypothetical protein GCM10027589_14500 [Actinocorallia lasiicapitis]
MFERVASNDPELVIDDQGRATYRGEPLTGVVQEYADSGDLSAMHSYRDGDRSGIWQGWYPDDVQRYSGSFHRNRHMDTWREWFPDGSLAVEDEYTFDGLLSSHKRWDETGTLIEHENDLTAMGVAADAIDFDTDGRLEHSSPVILGMPKERMPRYLVDDRPYSGQVVLRHGRDPGSIARVFTYVDGIPNGPTRRWYRSGALCSIGTFFNGEPAGVWQEWSENGELRRYYEFSHLGHYLRTLPPGETGSAGWAFPGLAVEQASFLVDIEQIAHSITSSKYRSDALRSIAAAGSGLASVLADVAVGDEPGRPAASDGPLVRRTRELVAKVRLLARSVTDPSHRARALAAVAVALSGTDPAAAQATLRDAEKDARSVTDPPHQARALGAVAAAVMAAGSDPAAARAILHDAELAARSVPLNLRGLVLCVVAEPLTTIDPEAARTLLFAAEGWSRASTAPSPRDESLRFVAEVVVRVDPSAAEEIVGSISDEDQRVITLGTLVRLLAAIDPEASDHLASSITDPSVQVRALGRLLPAADGTLGDRSAAEHLARDLMPPFLRSEALVEIVRTTISEALAEPDPTAARALLAEAERIARSITDWHRLRALAMLAWVLVGLDATAAKKTLRDAVDLAKARPNPDDRDEALCTLVHEIFDDTR